MNDIGSKKDTNERRNAIENDLRVFDDEDAFATPIDCDNYKSEFSSLLLDEEETEEETQAGSCDTLLTATMIVRFRLTFF